MTRTALTRYASAALIAWQIAAVMTATAQVAGAASTTQAASKSKDELLADSKSANKSATEALAAIEATSPDPAALQKAVKDVEETAASVARLEKQIADEAESYDLKSDKPPTIRILCVDVIDGHPTAKMESKTAVDGSEPKVQPKEERSAPTPCDLRSKAPHDLIGTGDVLVAITSKSFDNAEAYENKTAIRMTLFINGVDMAGDAKRIGVERNGDEVFLRYNVAPGDQSGQLWSALYRSGYTTQFHDLRIAVGWSGTSTSQFKAATGRIAITSRWGFGLALGFIGLLIIFSAVYAWRSDVLRDAAAPGTFADADALRRSLRGKGAADRAALLTARLPSYGALTDDAYRRAAAEAWTNPKVAVDIPQTLVGLALTKRGRVRRGTFSLTRTQLALWFLFAIGSGLYLWIVYGRLPPIDNSLLALLGISVGVTGVSFAVDSANGNDEATWFQRSQGFFNDLVTGWGANTTGPQVHRFQAVIVNALLLFVGIMHVGQQLSYPIFDPSWLVFLGISGAALTAGKQFAESKG